MTYFFPFPFIVALIFCNVLTNDVLMYLSIQHPFLPLFLPRLPDQCMQLQLQPWVEPGYQHQQLLRHHLLDHPVHQQQVMLWIPINSEDVLFAAWPLKAKISSLTSLKKYIKQRCWGVPWGKCLEETREIHLDFLLPNRFMTETAERREREK